MEALRKLKRSRTTRWGLVMLSILAMFLIAHAVIGSVTDSTRAEISRIAAENAALENELMALEDELAFIKTDKGLELYARAEGMCMPGEVRYTAGSTK